MFHQNKLYKSFAILSLSTFGLISCTPSFQTTAEKCATYSPVTLAIEETNNNSEFEILAGSTSNNYKLHLEDALNSLENIKSKASDGTTSPLSNDEQIAIQFIIAKANEKMGYVIENGKVKSASNPLDYLESLFSATDADEVIETFADAKQNLVRAISKADSVCNYTNSGINLVIEDPNIPSNENNIVKTVNAQLSLNYNPDSKGENKDTVDQIFLISLYDEPIEDLDISKRKAKSFSGISRIADTEFKAAGASLAKVRQVNLSDGFVNETFFFDDDFNELELGQLVTTLFNATCKDTDTGEEVACTDPSTTRTPQHVACDGVTDGFTADERNKYKENSFPVVPGHDELGKVQRLRMEVAYPNKEIRLYASSYAEKILRADTDIDSYDPEDSNDVITNPTRCEQQAVLTDLDERVTPEERKDPNFKGVRLTFVEDPNYDLIQIFDTDGEPVLDEDGNPTYAEPTPVFVFEGTGIEGREQQ